MAFSLAYYQVDGRERIERALSVLTGTERQFVLDLEAGRINEQGCLIDLIERRFGQYETRG